MQSGKATWILGGLVLAFLALVAWTTFGRGAAGGGDDVAAALARIEASQAKMQADQDALRAQLDAMRGGAPSGAAARMGGSRMPGPAMNSPDMLRKQADDVAKQRARLEQAFRGLAPAPSGDKVPAQLQKAFDVPGVRGAFALPDAQQVECRAGMCLITAQFGPNEDGGDWANRVLMEVPQSLSKARTVYVPLPGGGTELRIYAARVGMGNEVFGGG